MAMHKGEIYNCSNDNCGCEIQVTQSSGSNAKQNPRCACGQEMRRSTGVKAA